MDKSMEKLIDEELRRGATDAELQAMKEKLSNQISEKEFDQHIDVSRAIELYGNELLRKELKIIHKKHFGSSTASRSCRKTVKRLGILLAIALLFGMGYLLLEKTNPHKTSDQLFAEYYEPFNYSNTTRNAQQQSPFGLGILYQEKKYHEVINQFETHFKQNDNLGSDLLLAVGIAYTETNQPYKAVYQFDRIIDNGDFNYSDTALWYKALALLKANEINDCERVLNQLVEDNSSEYVTKSRSLLSGLTHIKVIE